MKTFKGNIFDFDGAICVPTNGIVKANGELVMGAGLAKQFAERFHHLPKALGKKVSTVGNKVFFYTTPDQMIFSFPTKEHWRDPSILSLIRSSAYQLKELVDDLEIDKVALPKVGCGLGGLNWTDVKKVLEEILDDRFYIVEK